MITVMIILINHNTGGTAARGPLRKTATHRVSREKQARNK